jgi:hypothetical protein
MGFTSRMSDLLAASDVLIHSTAGLTVLEAQMRGCRVISYGFGAGHVRINNRAYERFGLAEVARSRSELGPALRRALGQRGEPDPRFAQLPSPALLTLGVRPRARPLPVWRLRAARLATAAVAALTLLGWGLSTDDPYSLVAGILDLHPTTAVATTRPDVGLLIEAPAGLDRRLVADLSRHHAGASFAMPESSPAAALAAVREHGDEPIPLLSGGSPVSWLKTRGQLERTAQRLGLSGRLLYTVPHRAFTLGQYALAKTEGASPVSGAFVYTPGGDPSLLRAGEIVEIDLSRGSGGGAVLDAPVSQLRRRGLRAVSVSDLIGAGARHPQHG